MTDYKKYINALRKCAKEHENDRTSFGHIIVSDLCRDTANLLESLEQEPTTKENLVVGDCISRAELLKAVDTWDKFGCDADSKLVPYKDCYVAYIHYDDVVKAIKGMPSIQPKTGHWKKTGFIDKVICDVCNKRVWDTFTDGVLNFQYCPNCGAKMLPTDSEKER